MRAHRDGELVTVCDGCHRVIDTADAVVIRHGRLERHACVADAGCQKKARALAALPYRCPNCVFKRVDPCPHQDRADVDGRAVDRERYETGVSAGA